MGASAFALRSRCVKLNHRLELRQSFTNTAARLQEIVVEEPSSWRVFPAKGEVFEEQVEVGPHVLTFETGKLARFASGAVVVGIKDTRVLATVVGATKSEESRGFLPLQVEYTEKQYAQGRIPNSFMRREGAPKERELLVGRVIDRSIRPLFPKGYFYESQVMVNVLCSDGEQDPDVLAANAASAAIMVSDVPWYGPVGVVRIGRVDGKFMVNPDMDELTQSDLNLVYACTVDKTIMMETQSREISNNDLKSAFYLAHSEAAKLIPPQIRLASKVQNKKRSFHVVTVNEEVLEKVRSKAEVAINAVMGNSLYGKFERGKALGKIQADVEKIFKEEEEVGSLKVLPFAFDQVRKEVVRRNAFEKGERVDGRKLNEVRDLQAEVNLYAPLHGSALFSRGNTQVFCTVTLGAPEDAQKLNSLVGPPKKRFMVHYSFPPYSVNEVGRAMGLNRREVGHGTLAEKALLALLPPEEDFPYSVRVTSETMASDGSSSMATVCGGSLALMNAGVPLRGHVAGVSIGLFTKVDELTGKITDYRILTDILGLEDHVGDMDFKIAGTRSGITAIQLDIKPRGIPLEILCEALEPARVAREHILDRMEQEIREPTTEQRENAPCKGYFLIERERIRRLIGPHGSVLRNIEQTTGVRISISDSGRVCVLARDQASYKQAKEMVDSILGSDIEVGKIYDVCVSSIKDFGAFVEVDGGHQGLLHVSELSLQKVYNITDVLRLGQKLKVMCIGRDLKGNIKFSLKALLSSSKPSAVVQKLDSTTLAVTEDATTAMATNTEREVLVYEFPCEEPEKPKSRQSAVKVSKKIVLRDEGQVGHSRKKGPDLHKAAPKTPFLPVKSELVEKVDLHKEASKVSLSSPETKGVLRRDCRKKATKVPLSLSESKSALMRECHKEASEGPLLSSESTDIARQDWHREATMVPLLSAESKGATRFDVHKQATKNLLSSEENKCATKRSVKLNKIFPVKVDEEYLVVVHQIKALGAVLRMMDGELGKLFFDKEMTSSSIHTGDILHVKCSRIDSTGRPVFASMKSCQNRE